MKLEITLTPGRTGPKATEGLEGNRVAQREGVVPCRVLIRRGAPDPADCRAPPARHGGRKREANARAAEGFAAQEGGARR